ncbi:hypothetical protein D3C87_1403550 [compost metagenome]
MRREAEHQVHVVLDQQDGQILGQAPDGFHDAAALTLWHACARFIEEQHLGPHRECKGDLRKPLLAQCQLSHHPIRIGMQPQHAECLVDILLHACGTRRRGPPLHGSPVPLQHGDLDVVRHSEFLEQAADLERANDAVAHACVLRQLDDRAAVQLNVTRLRAQRPAQEVDQRRLAGAVRPDQCRAGSLGEGQRDVLRDRQAAKGVTQVMSLESVGHRATPLRPGRLVYDTARSTSPIKPSGRTMSTTISIDPMKNNQ